MTPFSRRSMVELSELNAANSANDWAPYYWQPCSGRTGVEQSTISWYSMKHSINKFIYIAQVM